MGKNSLVKLRNSPYISKNIPIVPKIAADSSIFHPLPPMTGYFALAIKAIKNIERNAMDSTISKLISVQLYTPP